MLDNEPYGKLIKPQEETKYQINLSPGRHECYLEVIAKDKNEEIFKSNVLVSYLNFYLYIFNQFENRPSIFKRKLV